MSAIEIPLVSHLESSSPWNLNMNPHSNLLHDLMFFHCSFVSFVQNCQTMEKNMSCSASDKYGDLQSASSYGVCSSPLRFMAHALTTGTVILVLGVISGVTCSMLVLKSDSKLQNGENAEDSCNNATTDNKEQLMSKHNSSFLFQRSDMLPFESMGISYSKNSFLSALGSMLKKAAPTMLHLSGSVNEALLTSVVCLPIGLYYLIWLSLVRINPKVGRI